MPAILLLASLALLGDPADPAVNFDNQVIPVLTKTGCNTGACHGAAVGRGGFRLSLYGGDPAFDYRSIVLELEGRRVNLARPDESLILLKPTGSLDHGGGYRLPYDGEGADMLRTWIRQGARRERAKKLVRLEVSPKSHVVQSVGESWKATAIAHFDDGSSADATRWTVFTPEDDAAVEIAPMSAVVKVLRRGRHVIVARYLDRVVAVEVVAPLSDAPIDLSKEPRSNFIDHHILERLSVLRLPVSPGASDATFLRRLYFDLAGRLPSADTLREFLSDDSPAKRMELVDRLLESDEFTEYWTFQLAKLLRIRSQPQDKQGALAYHKWLKERIAAGASYDRLARELLLATGDTHQVGPANFYRTVGGPREQAEFVSELFMGSRLRCANCHNHPLDRWTQDDYHGLAAIFAKLRRGRVIETSLRGEVIHPRTGEAAAPRIPGVRFIHDGSDGRQTLAAWLTHRDNPYFAKAIVNRLWKAMMGRGLVEPADDLRSTNPATHPELLERLALDFVEHGCDLRHTLRRIASSAAYARGPATADNQADDRYYSHALARPLPAEVLADAVSDVTGVPEQYGEQPLGVRAISLFDSQIPSDSLDILGRCSREESCESGEVATGGLSRQLHLFNGALLNRRLSDTEGALAKMIDSGKSAEEIVEEFYLRALTRHPTPPERTFWREQMNDLSGDGRRKILEDFLWSLLACREFMTNH